MTQQKAASLTSSLFARKGKASPASLLISEMEDAEAILPAAARNGTDLGSMVVGLNGAMQKRKPKPEAELPLLAFVEAQEAADVDVDASDPATEPSVAEIAVEAPAIDAAEGGAVEAAGAGRDVAAAELAPPASLLDRGGRSLRRVNGSTTATVALVQPAAAVEPSAANGLVADGDSEAPEGEEAAAPLTVSGDANVAAIEDAPQEEDTSPAAPPLAEDPVIVEPSAADAQEAPSAPAVFVEAGAEAAPLQAPVHAPVQAPEEGPAAVAPALSEDETPGLQETAPEEGVSESRAAAEADAAEAAATEAPEVEAPEVEGPPTKGGEAAPAAAAEARPEARSLNAPPSAAASVALRKAATQVPASPVLEEPAYTMPTPLPVPRRGLSWRSAALVALGAAAGLGLYLVIANRPEPTVNSVPAAVIGEAPSAAQADQPATESPASQTMGNQTTAVATAPAASVPLAGRPGAEAGTAETPAAGVASPGPVPAATVPAAAAPAVAAALPEPSFDIIRIEPDGQSIIAGRAEPGSEWILLNNGAPIAAVKADANGEWVVLPDASLVPGANAFSLVPKKERGKVAIPAPQAPSAAPDTNSQDTPATKAVTGVTAPRSDSGAPAEAVKAASAPAAAGTMPPKPKPKPQLQAAAAGAAPSSAPADFQAASSGDYEIQLASVRGANDAERERLRLTEVFPDLLNRMALKIQEARLDGAGTFYRVRSGAIDSLGTARDLCRRLEERGQGCLVVRRAADAASPAEVVEEAATEAPLEPTAQVPQQAQRP